MGYNTSKRVVLRMQSYLERLFTARRTITWPTKDAEALARKIREALTAVQHHPQYEKYIPVKSWYTIHARSGYVEAEWLHEIEGVTPQESGNEAIGVEEGLMFEDIIDLQDIVGAAIIHAMDAAELEFPNARLSDEDRLTLYRWTETVEWRYIDRDDAGIVLTKKSVDPILIWKPA